VAHGLSSSWLPGFLIPPLISGLFSLASETTDPCESLLSKTPAAKIYPGQECSRIIFSCPGAPSAPCEKRSFRVRAVHAARPHDPSWTRVIAALASPATH
jgi:hypothetical protein